VIFTSVAVGIECTVRDVLPAVHICDLLGPFSIKIAYLFSRCLLYRTYYLV
jgi:hypothetical protein